MKKVVIILILTALPIIGMAQDNVATVSTPLTETVEEVTPKKEASVVTKSTSLNSKIKKQLIKLNHKKSNEIISIKAYRKSLQIKVKTIKLC